MQLGGVTQCFELECWAHVNARCKKAPGPLGKTYRTKNCQEIAAMRPYMDPYGVS